MATPTSASFLELTQKFCEVFKEPICINTEDDISDSLIVKIVRDFLMKNDIGQEQFDFEVNVSRFGKFYKYMGNAMKKKVRVELTLIN